MFNIFNNLSTLYNSYKKKPQSYLPGINAPQAAGTYSTPASVQKKVPPPVIPSTTPPPLVKPPGTQPVAQPTAQQTYDQKYQNYLNQSQARKEQLAQQNEAEARQKAQEEYDANKTSLTASQGNLNQMMSGFRERSAAGQARLDKQAQQNRDRANVMSGENQRQLAVDRRDARNDNEKRYAALGTVDSMGTGSFQSANENTESNFLTLTAKNKQATQYAIQDIDNKLFDAKASSEEKIATEESKYDDAILEINRLLAGNETGKAQAIRAASQLLAQKRAEIMDEYEGLRITSEKEKSDLQAKLEAATMDDQKLKAIFASASPDFLKTGQPKTAQDQFIIFKYPKEAEAYMKMLTDSKTLSGSQSGGNKNKALTMVNNILSKDTKNITGALKTGNIPVLNTITGSVGSQTDYDGLKSLLALAERGQLKGSGTVSDFEAKMLEKAAMAGLNQDLPDNEFRRRLEILKQDLMSGGAESTGGQVITAPDGQQIIITD